MKTKEEILARMDEILQEMQQLRNEFAALEEPVVNESHQEETPDETPVVNEVSNVPIIEEEVEKLPAPPEVIYIDIPKEEEEEEDNDAIIGCQILTKFPNFYSGQCRVLGVHLKYKDYLGKVNPKNGKVNTKYLIYNDYVILVAKAFDGKILGTKQVAWKALSTWHTILRRRGIMDYRKNKNWMPTTILFNLD